MRTQHDTWLHVTSASYIDNMNSHLPQVDRILKLLWVKGFPWVCGTTFLSIYIPTYSQRIGELIVDGYGIERATCTDEHHKHSGGIAAYRMIGDIR